MKKNCEKMMMKASAFEIFKKHRFRLLFRLPLDHLEASHAGRKNNSIAANICKDQGAYIFVKKMFELFDW
jgi:hypothetical protein